MMNLDDLKLDSDAKEFISLIVDNYVLGKKYMSDGSNPYINTPGTQVYNIFAELSGKYVFNISLHKENDSNVEVYYTYDPKLITATKSEDEYDAEERFLKVKRAEFIYKISLLKSLLDSGYIFLVDDKDWDLFNTGKITDKDTKRWEEHGIRYHREIIKSKVLFDFISRFHSSTIIPSPQLISYKNNKFRTPEQRRFYISSWISGIAIGLSFLIGIGSPWLMTKYSKTSIDTVQLDTILNAIPKQIDQIKLNEEQVDSILTNIEKIIQSHNGKAENEKR